MKTEKLMKLRTFNYNISLSNNFFSYWCRWFLLYHTDRPNSRTWRDILGYRISCILWPLSRYVSFRCSDIWGLNFSDNRAFNTPLSVATYFCFFFGRYIWFFHIVWRILKKFPESLVRLTLFHSFSSLSSSFVLEPFN